MYRTGLAVEVAQGISEAQGTRITRRRVGKAYVTDIRVSDSGAGVIGRPAGRYITIESEPDEHALRMVFQKALELLLPREGVILVAGLGNPDITRDSLGSESISRLTAVCGRRTMCVMETDIAAKTGIETARMVRAVADEINASCVLAVDALACKDPMKIGRTVQITNTGIQPGSGVCSDSPALTETFVGVPVVAVGVPTVSELSGISGNAGHKGFLISPPDEDLRVRSWAEVIAGGINSIFR